MLVRFPQIPKYRTDDTFMSFGDIPYAKLNKINKTEGKQIGYLTQHTLFFILQGKKVFHFDRETIEVDINQLILLKRGIYSVSEYIPDGKQFEALMIFVPDTFINKFNLKNYGSQIPIAQESPFVLISNDVLLSSFKLQYLNYFGKSIKEMEKILLLKLQELFLLLTASSHKLEVLRFIKSCADKQPTDLEFIVKTYLLQPLTISEFANLSSRSVSSFKRDFQKQFNMPPKEWINQRRLAYANTLLKNSSKTISETCFECGFENVSHFIKIFKKRYGITPNSLRTKKYTI